VLSVCFFVKHAALAVFRKTEKMSDDDRCCSLLLDEMSLKRALTYVKSADRIVGFADFDNGSSTNSYASQALVVMARGIKSNWKQPLAFYFSCNSTPAAKLKEIVTEAVARLKTSGLKVVTVICDQGATNMQMFRMFDVSKDKPHAVIDGDIVFFMFDPPHLLKSVRNNLVKHPFSVCGKPVKWQYISDFYEADHKQLVKLAPKLSHKHINLPPFANMRVRLAAQVFSHSVAAGIYTHVSLGAMTSAAAYTAEFVDKLDMLFDCFNAGSFSSSKPYRHALSDNSKHWKLLSECQQMFHDLTVVGSTKKPPCIDGFELSINALIQMFRSLRERFGLKFLLTNRLNQDALENHFAIIRSRGGFRDNPDPYAFEAAFRQVLVQHLLATPRDANCSDDMTQLMLSMQDVSGGIGNRLHSVSVVLTKSHMTSLCANESVDTSCLSADSLSQLCDSNVCEVNAVSYVAGYVVKVILSSHQCVSCSDLMLCTDTSICNTDLSCVFFDFKLYDGYKSNSLHVPSQFAVLLFSQCRDVFVKQFDKVMCGSDVLYNLFERCIDCISEMSKSLTEPCVQETVKKSVALFLRILVYHKVKVINRDMSCKTNKKTGKRNRKALKIVHD